MPSTHPIPADIEEYRDEQWSREPARLIGTVADGYATSPARGVYQLAEAGVLRI